MTAEGRPAGDVRAEHDDEEDDQADERKQRDHEESRVREAAALPERGPEQSDHPSDRQQRGDEPEHVLCLELLLACAVERNRRRAAGGRRPGEVAEVVTPDLAVQGWDQLVREVR